MFRLHIQAGKKPGHFSSSVVPGADLSLRAPAGAAPSAPQVPIAVWQADEHRQAHMASVEVGSLPSTSAVLGAHPDIQRPEELTAAGPQSCAEPEDVCEPQRVGRVTWRRFLRELGAIFVFVPVAFASLDVVLGCMLAGMEAAASS